MMPWAYPAAPPDAADPPRAGADDMHAHGCARGAVTFEFPYVDPKTGERRDVTFVVAQHQFAATLRVIAARDPRETSFAVIAATGELVFLPAKHAPYMVRVLRIAMVTTYEVN